MTDQAINDAVEDEILYDAAVGLNDVDVSSSDGIVTLKGTVDNLMAKRRAARLAEIVKGVRSVSNNIQVKPAAERSDSAIAADIRDSLLYDRATDLYDLKVKVKDNRATLNGTVQSWQEKQLAEKVAAGVKGVTAIENRIDVDYKSERSDLEIEPEVEKALRWDALVDHALIDVNVDDGNVTLTGTVGSAAEKRRARYDAWVAGVNSVDDSGLDVERWARDQDLRKNKYQIKSEDEIEQAIEDALVYNPQVLSFNVEAEATGSLVTLRGNVRNLKAKRSAAQTARNTVGVTSVINRLKVRPEDELTDAEIASNVRDALLRDPLVDRYQIVVTADDGKVTLNGSVDTYFEKGTADDVASRAKGVTTVKNNLEVDYGDALTYDPYLDENYIYDYDWYDYQPSYTFETDAEIKDDISDEMWWSPFVGEDEVTVSVENGVATLTGTVDSLSEQDAAIENAYEGGATWVVNKIEIE